MSANVAEKIRYLARRRGKESIFQIVKVSIVIYSFVSSFHMGHVGRGVYCT